MKTVFFNIFYLPNQTRYSKSDNGNRLKWGVLHLKLYKKMQNLSYAQNYKKNLFSKFKPPLQKNLAFYLAAFLSGGNSGVVVPCVKITANSDGWFRRKSLNKSTIYYHLNQFLIIFSFSLQFSISRTRPDIPNRSTAIDSMSEFTSKIIFFFSKI